MDNEKKLSIINDNLHLFKKEVDKDFALRVWKTDNLIYEKRIKALSFENLDLVLDAGCGAGQWLAALSKLNKKTIGLEYDLERCTFTKNTMAQLGIKNTDVFQGSVEKIDFQDNVFDAIFSFGVILCADYRKALKEFYRVLKPGGKLYFNTNGLGWYLYNMINTHNDSKDFSSKEMAKVAISTTIHYYATNQFISKKYAAVITPKDVVEKDLKDLGFKNIIISAEGTINFSKEKINSFFKGEYEGYEGVTEYYCEK